MIRNPESTMLLTTAFPANGIPATILGLSLAEIFPTILQPFGNDVVIKR